jgi:hypothetical protein
MHHVLAGAQVRAACKVLRHGLACRCSATTANNDSMRTGHAGKIGASSKTLRHVCCMQDRAAGQGSVQQRITYEYTQEDVIDVSAQCAHHTSAAPVTVRQEPSMKPLAISISKHTGQRHTRHLQHFPSVQHHKIVIEPHL